MSYSRWGDSYWYTFWDATGDSKKKKYQLLNVDCEFIFTYQQIKYFPNACIAFIKQSLSGKEREPIQADIDELLCIFKEFVSDMDTEFPGGENE